MAEEYRSIINSLNGDDEGRRTAASYMESSTAIVHGDVIASTFMPKLYDMKTHHELEHVAVMTHHILCKVVKRYLDDPSYRSIFDYDPIIRELIMLPQGYDALLPFLRLDLFLNEQTLADTFCEINADGSSGMNECREVNMSIQKSTSWQHFSQQHKTRFDELFETWIDRFIAIYQTFVNARSHPNIAICDYLGNATLAEFEVYRTYFARRGYSCSIVDVRDLHFDGHKLTDSTGHRIDALWRRCVTNDVREHWNESQDLINAVRAEAVALIGGFSGHIAHDKQLFRALRNPQTVEMFTETERSFIKQHIPYTTFLDSDHVNLSDIREQKDRWIIKPTDCYGATDVFAGCDFDSNAWNTLIDHYANKASGQSFLVQSYITPYQTLTLPPTKNCSTSHFEPYNNLVGLYIYDGRFEGVYSRLGPHPTICGQREGITAPTAWVRS